MSDKPKLLDTMDLKGVLHPEPGVTYSLPDIPSTAWTERLMKLIRLLDRHKERYVRAWIAATGIPPEEACIVTNMQPNGEVMVVKRRDEVLTCCKCHEPIIKEDGFFYPPPHR